jgi:hypothetical protein
MFEPLSIYDAVLWRKLANLLATCVIWLGGYGDKRGGCGANRPCGETSEWREASFAMRDKHLSVRLSLRIVSAKNAERVMDGPSGEPAVGKLPPFQSDEHQPALSRRGRHRYVGAMVPLAARAFCSGRRQWDSVFRKK